MQINEITQIDLLLEHLDPADQENFCYAWYQGLDVYKDNPNALLLVANATLTHWEIPLYAVNVTWDEVNECFIWHFGDNNSPEYP
ncbi:hypothetical protein UFOVP71_161 [uncultured Caudovirales phage]|uniref:Uncharacterized protein n=1 Tax=uncultured Caudovirales phage TaxID=2100421 RepID=A0A6J5TA04_9CAUD|nr:hypothetical protein UFOVP71_161 [uncultured Caudovirales phage]